MTDIVPASDLWLAAGPRTPFVKVDGPLARYDAIELSVPVIRHALDQLGDHRPDLCIWGTVVPNLTWSNIAREAMIEAGADPTIPAFSTVMACSTSMIAAIEAAGMLDGTKHTLALVGGVESMSRIQIGLSTRLSDRLRKILGARSFGDRLTELSQLRPREIGLYIPQVRNRATGKSMGEHCEEMAKEWSIARADQDAIALQSHQRAVAGWKSGFFRDLVVPFGGIDTDTLPRADTSLERLAKLRPVFDTTSGRGTLTAGNSSPLTDGAASLWVAHANGLARLPSDVPRVRLIDWEVGAVDLFHEGLLMAPAYSVPRMLARNGLTYADVALWEIHEAFAAQVLVHLRAFEDARFLKEKAKVDAPLGRFPVERMNPNGGSVALGHPFGATGARILSQAVKELAALERGAYAVVSICADGGQGTVALLQAG